MAETHPNFDVICRFCLKCDPVLQPIFVKNEPNTMHEGYTTPAPALPSFTKMIHYCIGLDVKRNDEFPKFLCFDCTNQLRISYTFRQQCLTSLEKLKEFIVNRTQQSNNFDNEPSTNVATAIKLENYSSVIDNNGETKQKEINCSTTISQKSQSKSTESIDSDTDYNNDDDNYAEDNFQDNDNYFDNQSIRLVDLVETKNIKQELQQLDALIKVAKKRRSPKSRKSDNVDGGENSTKKIRGKYKKREKKERRTPKEREMQICPICGEQRLSIENHMLTMHTDEKPCCCEICGKWIKTRSNLHRHHQRVHVAVRKYHCDICKFAFKSRAHIIRHMLSHSKIRNYECHVCGHRFRDSHTRNLHVRLHAEDKRIKCPYCEKRFMAPNRLKNHIGIHTGEMPYNCELCPKQFKYSASATVHRREHMIDKSYYQCGSCEFQVKPFSLLKVHLRTEKHFFNEYFSANDKET